MQPDFYNQYYSAVEKSRVHSNFCRCVFGIDLCQHGFADLEQLELVLQLCPLSSKHAVLDIGCGNGMITEYFCGQSGAIFTGIDNSIVAIGHAKSRTRANAEKLQFIQGDINDLRLPIASYDLILLIDSIYFSTNYDLTISRLKESLKPAGFILIFYSIGPALIGSWDFPKGLLEAKNTPLAEVLTMHGFTFECQDLTASDYILAKRRRAYLKAHKKKFYRDNLGFIYENRFGDSLDIIKAIDQGLHKRLLYSARQKLA